MTPRRDGNGLQDLHTLLRGGSATGLTDGQLLERFATRGGDASEAAFAALVGRHGPMVLRVCRSVLRDEHEARDAFQTTFLALARRGGSLWVQDSVGPWLHRVARRAAVRAWKGAKRRREVEQRAAVAAHGDPRGAGDEDLAAVVHQEIDRLPERYRVPVILCDLEGYTQEEAARHLGCPVGTLKSRLTRARNRLRGRLARRGLAPGAAFAGPVRLAVPEGLEQAVTEAALRLAPAATAGGVAGAVLLNALRAGAMKAAVGAAVGVGLLLFAARVPARQAAEAKGPAAPAAAGPAKEAARKADEPYDWRRADAYAPPDFARFFPDDPDGGAALDRLWQDKGRDARPAAEVLAAVRKGMRRTTVGQNDILSWVGGRFVWNASPQNPDAMEILYHATDPRGPVVGYGESPSIYYGLMRVEPKTPAVLHALVDWCMQVDCPMDWYWAGWSGRARRDELLSYLKPYLDSNDPPTRERAAVVETYLKQDPARGEAYRAWSAKVVRAKSGHRLPGVEKAIRDGSGPERLAALRLVLDERLWLLMGESSVAAFRACAGDQDPAVRREVARTLGSSRFYEGKPWGGTGVEVLLRLAKDDDPGVRYDAVYYGLTPLGETRRGDAIRALLDVAARDRRPDLLRRITWGLQYESDTAARLLDGDLRGPDPARREAARAVYKDVTGRTPPNLGPASPDVRKGYAAAFRDLYDHLGRVYPCFALKGIDWERVGRELLPRVDGVETEEQFGRLVEELVARLEDSHAVVLSGTATPPAPDFPEWDPWLACLEDDRGRPVVYSVPRTSAAWKAGVRPGMTVVSVNGVPAAEALDRWMGRQRRYVGYSSDRALRYDAFRLFHRQPERGAKVSLALEGVDGRTTTVDLTADARRWYIPRLPVPVAGIEDGGADVQSVLRKDGIGYIHVRRIRQGFDVSLDQALTALGDVKGLILDVRGNSGGGFDTRTAFRNFDPAPADGSAPHRPHYRGPIALLIDERCISAGEGWASWFVANKKARLFGSATSGASSRKETFTLSNGLYKVVVPVKAYHGFLDRPIERRGLEPDVAVRCTAADLSQGKDTVAEAAAAWLVQTGRE